MARRLAVVVAILHLGVLSMSARAHPLGGYASETDFYGFYAPAAERIGRGELPQDDHHLPGYALMLAGISAATGSDLFSAGKWLSVVAAVAAGGLAFLLFAPLFHPWAGLAAPVLLFRVAQLAR